MPRGRVISRISMAMPDAMLKASGKLNVRLCRASRGRLFGKVGRRARIAEGEERAPMWHAMNEQFSGFVLLQPTDRSRHPGIRARAS